jgi:hypothetical protein
MDNNKYLVIKATKWNFQKFVSYSVVSDKAYPLNKACDILVASKTMNENDSTTFHLQEISFTETDKPLVLTKDMEVDNELNDFLNGKEVNHELI